MNTGNTDAFEPGRFPKVLLQHRRLAPGGDMLGHFDGEYNQPFHGPVQSAQSIVLGGNPLAGAGFVLPDTQCKERTVLS